MVMQGPTKNTDGCPGSGRQSGCRLWLAWVLLNAHCSQKRLINVSPPPPGTWACFGSWNRFPSRRDAAVQTRETCGKPRFVVGQGACVVVGNIEAPICPTWTVCCCCSMLSCIVADRRERKMLRRRACQLGRGKGSRGLSAISTPIAWSHGHVEGQAKAEANPSCHLLLTAR